MSETFYNFKLDLEPNLIDNVHLQVLRMSTIQLVTQIMFYTIVHYHYLVKHLLKHLYLLILVL